LRVPFTVRHIASKPLRESLARLPLAGEQLSRSVFKVTGFGATEAPASAGTESWHRFC
jgi:hypothetical protein